MAIICHCEAVRERTIVKAIHRGATTIADVQDACSAATQCGGCVPAILELLAVHGERAGDHGPLLWAESSA